MKAKINFERYGESDCYILSGENIEDIQQKNKDEMAIRGLDANENNCWSEILEDD